MTTVEKISLALSNKNFTLFKEGLFGFLDSAGDRLNLK